MKEEIIITPKELIDALKDMPINAPIKLQVAGFERYLRYVDYNKEENTIMLLPIDY